MASMALFDEWEYIGAGGYSEVYSVVDRAVHERRAVKLIDPSTISDKNGFASEAHTLTQLRHERIVTVYEAGFGPTGGLEPYCDKFYISTELMHGGSVEGHIKDGPLSLRTAVRICTQVCEAVQFAHDNSFLHRDIKPANIFLDGPVETAGAKLGDFGLARFGKSVPTAEGYLTHIAPEVLETGTATQQTDVYALGMSLYKMLNGAPMSQWGGPSSLLPKHIAEGKYPRRKTMQLYVPRKLRNVVSRALNVDTQRRYRSADELRHALEHVQIVCDWVALTDGTGAYYYGTSSLGGIFTARIHRRADTFSFEITKISTVPGRPRNLLKDFFSSESLAKVEQHASSVMQRIATTGR